MTPTVNTNSSLLNVMDTKLKIITEPIVSRRIIKSKLKANPPNEVISTRSKKKDKTTMAKGPK